MQLFLFFFKFYFI